MTIVQKIIKNALANSVGFAVEAIIAFCMLPYIIHRIGESSYGIWALTLSVTGYMGILNLGLRPAVNKYVAQYNALGENGKIRDLVQASLFSYMICGFIIIVLSGLLSVYCNQLFNIPHEYQDVASVLILLVGSQMAIGLIAVIYGGVISGLQRYEINNGIEIAVMLSRTAIIVGLLDRYPHIYTIAIANFCMVVAGHIATVVIAREIADIKKIKLFRMPTREVIITIFSFSMITFVIGIVGRIMSYVDSMIIASMLTTTAVTYYTVGSRLVKYTKNLIEVLVNVIAPATSALNAKNNENIKAVYLYSSKVCCLICFPILSFLIIQGNEFLMLWIGEVYPDSYMVMCILSIGGFILFPQLNTIPILYGLAKHKIIMWLSIVEGILSVSLSIFLCSYYGVIGIAIGLAFPKAFLGGLIYPVYLSKYLKLNLTDIIIKCYLRSLISTIPLIIGLYLFKKYYVLDNMLLFLSQIFLLAVLHLLAMWSVGLTQFEKKQIILLINNKRLKKA